MKKPSTVFPPFDAHQAHKMAEASIDADKSLRSALECIKEHAQEGAFTLRLPMHNELSPEVRTEVCLALQALGFHLLPGDVTPNYHYVQVSW